MQQRFDQNGNHESLQMVRGEELQTWHYHEFRCTELATSVKSPGQIEIEAKNIDPNKSYVLGFSWWNGYWHGNHEDNHQSVFIEFIEEGKTKRIPLLKDKILPRFDGKAKKDVEQVEMKLPEDAIKASRFKIIVTKGDEIESDTNVYMSEVWLRDGKNECLLPEELTPVGECPRPRVKYSAPCDKNLILL